MKIKFRIPSDIKKVKQASQKIQACLDSRNLVQASIFDVQLAVEEAIVNAIRHGNKSQLKKTVHIDCEINDEAIVIAVEDEGQGFDVSNLPDPTAGENLLKPGGRGLLIIRNKMDKVEFNSKGNKIIMTKFFKGGH